MPDESLPATSADTERFWAACDDGRFVVQRCTDCGRERFYPAAVCPDCWSRDFEEVELDGRGTVESYTVVHHAPREAFEDDVPYVVALVGLSDDVTVMANVRGDPEAVAVGDPVTLCWEERGDRQLYQFELEEG